MLNKPVNTFLPKFYKFWTTLVPIFINFWPFLTFQIINWLIFNWLLFGELVWRVPRLIMNISWTELSKNMFYLKTFFYDWFLWIYLPRKPSDIMPDPQFWTVWKSRMNIKNSYLLKFYFIYLNFKNFIFLEKVWTKVSTNCVVIVFFCERTFAGQ